MHYDVLVLMHYTCPIDIISPPEFMEHCAKGGVLEPDVMLLHHTYGSSGDN